MSAPPVVCDNGTGFVKCGWAGKNFPDHTFPCLLGRPNLRAGMQSLPTDLEKLGDVVIGTDAAKFRQFLELSYPMSEGIIRNWEEMDLLWKHTFEEKLGIDIGQGLGNTCQFQSKDLKILLTEAPGNPKRNRIQMFERMFESYNFKAVHCATQAVLVLYAQGLVTGVVLDSGDGVSHVIPAFEGVVMERSIQRLNVAGRHVTTRLVDLLQAAGHNMHATANFDTVRQIKERLCYIALDPVKERELALQTTCLMDTYTLPDGRKLKLGRERFEAGEVLFDPELVDVTGKGLHEMLVESITSCDIDLRTDFYRHIVLSGGTTMFRGLPSRLEREVKNHWMKTKGTDAGGLDRMRKQKIKIEDPPRRKDMVFIGGAVLANLMAEQDDFWTTKEDWDESGAACLRKR